ncbi:hypothetical protein AAEX37_00997 [Oligella sp. MSHR50489EDL]|uniref:hypothetical protein n=1 Tax=Oligella sp. MSHR50489EDL TaxID=3139409 RepID=UPI003D813CF1
MAKEVKLRAFEISNPLIISASKDILKPLKEKLDTTDTTQERCMILSHEDSNKEQDLISYYESFGQNSSLYCTLLRIAPGSNVTHVTKVLLGKKQFSIEELENQEIDTAAIYKYHFDFSIKGNFLVTNLRGNITIKRLQTYLAWFLNDENLEITPVIEPPSEIKLSDLSVASFSEPRTENAQQNTSSSTTKASKIMSLAKSTIKDLLKDSDSLKDIELDEIIEAELLIKFRKPRTMDDEVYQKKLGSILKPVADLENVMFRTNDRKRLVSGKELLLVKTVSVETTESGHLVEQDLLQEMSKFLDELIQKNKSQPNNL